ncbi:amidohydrolase [Clostridiaceae bacterium HSG29]|nr:amidohydrolase [Clostridiaceae bacterium HSG29]
MLLLKNLKIYTMENEIIENGSILIKNGKFVEISEIVDVNERECEVYDMKGMIATPGLIDAHCHLGMFEDAIGFEGNDVNEMTSPITPELRAIDGINPMDKTFTEALAGGVTTVSTGPGSANVIGGQFAIIKTYGVSVDEMIVKAPSAMKCAFGENPKRVYNAMKKSPSTRMATAAELRKTLYEALEYDTKIRRGDDGKFDFRLKAMLPVIHKDIPLKAHAHRADDILTAIRIAKEFDVDLTLDHCTEGHLIVDILKNEKYPAIVGPTFGHRSKFELKNKSFTTPGILNKAGVKVAIMTDSPVIPLQHLNMCAALAVRSGMDENEALKAITINPAEILKIDNKVGSIKIGKDADLAIWDNHPFDIQARAIMTVINGEVIKNELE